MDNLVGGMVLHGNFWVGWKSFGYVFFFLFGSQSWVIKQLGGRMQL